MSIRVTMCLVSTLGGAAAALAGSPFTEFTKKAAWTAATAGRFSTITFTEFPDATAPAGLYLDEHGVGFLSLGTAFATTPDDWPFDLFPNDGWGAIHEDKFSPEMEILFDEPHNIFAIDHPWVAQVEFRKDGALVGTTSLSGTPSTVGNFIGIISDEPFDRARVFRPNLAMVMIDDVHFGFVSPDLTGDLTGDGTVGVDDLLILLEQWGDCADCDDCPADLTGDCAAGVDDLLILLANWTG